MRPFSLERAADDGDLRYLTAAFGNGSHVGAPTQYLGGGTTLLDLMKLDVMRPDHLVDIGDLGTEHGTIEASETGLTLGALVRMSAAADHPAIRRDYKALADALLLAASPQIRNMATLGGNVLQRTRCSYFRDPSWTACNKRTPGSGCAAIGGNNRMLAVLGVSEHCIAHYPGDFAVALVAFGATVTILGTEGTERVLPFEELHRLPGDTPHLETNLCPGDLIIAIHVPAGPWARRSLYLKVRERESYAFALSSAAVGLNLQPDGTVASARIGLGGVATKPWRSHEAEAALTGRVLNEAVAQEAADRAFDGAVTHGENAFKPELGRQTLVRALLQAADREI